MTLENNAIYYRPIYGHINKPQGIH